MTPEEQQQVNAAMAYMERLCASLARDGANMASALAGMEQKLKALEPKDNVVPIEGAKA